MHKFFHPPRFQRQYRKVQYTRNLNIRSHVNIFKRLIRNKNEKKFLLPRVLAGISTGVALWFCTKTVFGQEYGLYDSITKMLEKFEQYASLNINGEKLMTKQDFINSVSVGSIITPEETARFSACFELADINKDHNISFFEYALFMHLTAAPDASLKMSFRLFDTNGDGYISLDEFQNVISLHTISKIDVHARCTKLFGDDGKKKLNYSEFMELLRTISQDILVDQFRQKELPNKPNYINPSICAELLESRAPSPTPKYLIETFNNMKKSKEPISMNQYLAFLEVMKHLDNIELAIELYTTAGGSIDKKNFSRAMQICTGKIMNDSEVDTIFGMFDEKNKGLLDSNSLNYIRNKREKIYYFQPEEKREIMSTIASLLLGAASAKLSAIIVYPFDKIKTRQQLHPIQLHPMTGAINRILHKEGFKGYLRGVGSMLTIVTPEKIVKLTVSNYFRLIMEKHGRKGLLKEAIAGFFTGVAQAFLVNPFEIVKLKFQMLEHKANEGTWVSLYKLGLKNIYRGLSVTLIRDITFYMTYFTIFSWGKSKLQDEGQLGGLRLFISHATAAILAVVVSAPADTVRCHFQYSDHKLKSPIECYHKIVSQEGVHGLYKGTVPRSILVVNMFALTFTMFDLLQRKFQPGKIIGLSTWQRDRDLVREKRLINLGKTLKNEYGLDLEPKKRD